MAVLCRDHNLLFIKAPRTGSSAVSKALREKLGGESIPPEPIFDERRMFVGWQHSTLKQLLQYGFLNQDDLEGLVIVSGIRNPYDSVVSSYIKKSHTLPAKLNGPDAWPHSSRNRLRSIEYASSHSFSQWVKWQFGRTALRNFKEQKSGSMYARYARQATYMIRFENLQEDFSQVLKLVGVKEKIEIPHFNVTKERKEKKYKDYYDWMSRLIVYYRFGGDIRNYGYRF